MKKTNLFIALLAAMVLMLAACGSKEEASKKESTETAAAEDKSAGASEEGSAYPMTVSPTVASTESEEGGSITFEDEKFEKRHV